jgi:hypothetical protein
MQQARSQHSIRRDRSAIIVLVAFDQQTPVAAVIAVESHGSGENALLGRNRRGAFRSHQRTVCFGLAFWTRDAADLRSAVLLECAFDDRHDYLHSPWAFNDQIHAGFIDV